MTNEKLYEALGNINEKHVYEARAYHKAKKPGWVKWGAIAACLVLVCVAAISLFLHNNDSVATPGIADAAGSRFPVPTACLCPQSADKRILKAGRKSAMRPL